MSDYFEADNINDISNFIYREVIRHGQEGTLPLVSVHDIILATFITQIQQNLLLTGHATNESALPGNLGLRTLGLELIEKAKDAYSDLIPLP